MKSVQQLADAIVAREGERYTNDPNDPGGPTKYGVTIRTFREIEPGATISELKAITSSGAAKIFIEYYFNKPKIDLLPKPLQPSVFDMYVNAGSNAVRILQRLLAKYGEPVAVDGGLGPATAAATSEALHDAPAPFQKGNFVDAYGIARRNYYFRLADDRPGLRKFARTAAGGKGGWIKRAETFISPQYRLTTVEFKQLTHTWG